jgi:hypothetical protein
VEYPDQRCRGVARITVDGVDVPGHSVPIVANGGTRHVRVVLGGTAFERRRSGRLTSTTNS